MMAPLFQRSMVDLLHAPESYWRSEVCRSGGAVDISNAPTLFAS